MANVNEKMSSYTQLQKMPIDFDLLDSYINKIMVCAMIFFIFIEWVHVYWLSLMIVDCNGFDTAASQELQKNLTVIELKSFDWRLFWLVWRHHPAAGADCGRLISYEYLVF